MSDKLKIKHHIKPKKEPKKVTLDAYEKNLKLNLEAKRKDFDNITTSIIPSQLNLVKTYLWLSSLSFSTLLLLMTKREDTSFDLSLLSLFLGAVCGISTMLLSLFAIHSTRNRHMAHAEDNDMFANIAQNELEHSEGLLILLDITSHSLKGAKQTVKKTSNLLRGAFITTVACVFFIVTGAVLHFSSSNTMKGGTNMAEEQKLTRPTAPSQPVKQPEVLQANSREIFENKQTGRRVIATEDKKPTLDKNESKK
ncbi:MAG: hypothetical protein JW802_06850 [Campylobacterales bacterium]|nr:hypothetical protein [Campylobacterales bacterium]